MRFKLISCEDNTQRELDIPSEIVVKIPDSKLPKSSKRKKKTKTSSKVKSVKMKPQTFKSKKPTKQQSAKKLIWSK